jgi:hypothetical protein
MTRLSRGDIVERRNGNKYILVQTEVGHLHLVNIYDGNRWADNGIKVRQKDFDSYVTLDDINNTDGYDIFDGVCFFNKLKNINFENKKDTEPKQTVNEISIETKEIERVVAHAMMSMHENCSPKQIMEKTANDFFDFLVEKEIIKEEK